MADEDLPSTATPERLILGHFAAKAVDHASRICFDTPSVGETPIASWPSE
jgi:hypothetical protein